MIRRAGKYRLNASLTDGSDLCLVLQYKFVVLSQAMWGRTGPRFIAGGFCVSVCVSVLDSQQVPTLNLECGQQGGLRL